MKDTEQQACREGCWSQVPEPELLEQKVGVPSLCPPPPRVSLSLGPVTQLRLHEGGESDITRLWPSFNCLIFSSA